jgi:hypothetical protein
MGSRWRWDEDDAWPAGSVSGCRDPVRLEQVDWVDGSMGCSGAAVGRHQGWPSQMVTVVCRLFSDYSDYRDTAVRGKSAVPPCSLLTGAGRATGSPHADPLYLGEAVASAAGVALVTQFTHEPLAKG